MRYICRYCGKEFDDFEVKVFTPDLDCPTIDWDYENELICPYCETFDIEEINESEEEEWE